MFPFGSCCRVQLPPASPITSHRGGTIPTLPDRQLKIYDACVDPTQRNPHSANVLRDLYIGTGLTGSYTYNLFLNAAVYFNPQVEHCLSDDTRLVVAIDRNSGMTTESTNSLFAGFAIGEHSFPPEHIHYTSDLRSYLLQIPDKSHQCMVFCTGPEQFTFYHTSEAYMSAVSRTSSSLTPALDHDPHATEVENFCCFFRSGAVKSARR